MDLSIWRLAVPLLVVAVIAGLFWGSRKPAPPPVGAASDTSTPLVAQPAASMTVHVSGWVGRPGLYQLAPHSRVADAVAAAGGLRPGADTAGVNLAAIVADGDQIVIPGPTETAAPSEEGSATADGPVSLNRATAADLEALPGVGPVLAERIVAYREEHGRFTEVEGLLDVPGIGEAKLAALRDLVVP